MVGPLGIRHLNRRPRQRGGMEVFELSVPPNSSVPPPHSHTANEECVYVLEGVLRYAVDDVARDLHPWRLDVHAPRGSVHQFSNPHDAPSRWRSSS